METAWSSGRMDAGHRLQAVTISPSQAGSCTCCGLCHQETGCVSLSFNSATSECELYSSVASYATLQPDSANQWTYYVMPGRSETGQFCRQDSDCVTVGDSCRGRFCTTLDKVTCRTVADTFGSIRHYAVEPTIYGWVKGKQVMLNCWMTSAGYGYTAILWSVRGFQFDSSTVMEYNLQLDSGKEGQSMLDLAEYFRNSENDPTYHISVWSRNERWSILLNYQAPRDEPVFSGTARAQSWLNPEPSSILYWTPSMLWMPSSGSTLLTINADDGKTSTGAMARTDGNIEYDVVWIFMHE